MIELISGVTYRSGLLNDIEVEEALSKGQVPQVPMKTAKHKNHELESAVQNYLQRHGIPSSLEYQSVFVGWQAGTAVEERIVRAYGTPLVVNPSLISELVVASLGDLQNVVASIGGSDESLDDRIVNLAAAPNPTEALKELVDRATAHNRQPHTDPLYVEARIYRRWNETDFLRPCKLSDFKIRMSKTRQTGSVRRTG